MIVGNVSGLILLILKGEREGKSDGGGGGRVEAIRHFHVSDDKLPQTFRLLNVQGLPPWANTSSVSIRDVIQVMIHSMFIYLFELLVHISCLAV